MDRPIQARPGLPPTPFQLDYVRGLQRKLHLTDRLLDNHCVTTYGKPLGEMDRAEVSRLLDEMLGWQAIPADMQRAMGQVDLPGFGA
jgi:hypothetical protein